MFRQTFPLLIPALMLTLVNCSSSPHSPNESYYLIATNTKVPYWQQAAAGLNQAARQMQVRAEMVGPDSYDPQAEHAEFQRVMGKKPTGILISAADAETLKSDIDAAVAQGIPVITIDSDAPSSKRLTFVGTDNYKAGQMGARVAVERLQGKGNVVVYTIPEQTNLKERLHGYRDVFGEHPGIKITEVVDMKGDARVAFDKTMDMLDKNSKGVDAFVCLEAIACPEISEVLDRKKVTGKVVVAMDTDQRTLEAIQKGFISATVGQKPFTMANFGLHLLDDIHHNAPSTLNASFEKDPFSPYPTFIDTGEFLIDKSNVDQFIQERNSATKK